MQKFITAKHNAEDRKRAAAYRRECFKSKRPIVVVRPRRKFSTVTWDCDPLYPTRNQTHDQFEDLTAIVNEYSLANAGYGIEHGAIMKVELTRAPKLAKNLYAFLAENVRRIDF